MTSIVDLSSENRLSIGPLSDPRPQIDKDLDLRRDGPRQACLRNRLRRMAHYSDVSEYCYGQETFHVPGTVNIEWLGASLDFDQMDPDESGSLTAVGLTWREKTALASIPKRFRSQKGS
jgi:hypothetical protein